MSVWYKPPCVRNDAVSRWSLLFWWCLATTPNTANVGGGTNYTIPDSGSRDEGPVIRLQFKMRPDLP